MKNLVVGAIVLLATLGACVTPCLSTQGAVIGVAGVAPLPDEPLRVITYNMLHGFADRLNDRTLDARLDLLVAELARLRPDVILLQEASTTPGARHCNVVDTLRTRLNDRLSSAGLAYASVYYAAHGSRIIGFYEGSAILSLHPIVHHEKLTYSAQSRTPPERRIAVRATINVQGTQIDFFSTHLTNQDEARGGSPVVDLQAGELADVVGGLTDAGRLVIIGGDFNAAPESAVVGAMLSAGARDVWTYAVPGAAGGTSLRGSVTSPDAKLVRRIDYIFVAGEGVTVHTASRVLDHAVIAGSAATPLWPSDHAGVMVELWYR